VFNQSSRYTWILRILLILLFIALSFFLFFKSGLVRQNENQKEESAVISNIPQIPEEITPDGMALLIRDKIPFLLINAGDVNLQIPSSPGPTRLIYYTTAPSSRAAQKLVSQDRASKPTGFPDAIKLISQRLTGTPLEWKRLGLTFLNDPIPTQPQLITPRQLSEAIKDNVDLQIVDLRPVDPKVNEAPAFPTAFRWMPHEVLGNLAKLSKEKWIVLVGYSNEGVRPIAWELFQKGYLLTTILDGGYPAWVSSPDR
jgi:hypothetical protein